MKTKTKIVFAKKYIFKLTYRLTVKKSNFFILIQSEKFDKNTFLFSEKATISGVETCEQKLPKMTLGDALEFFREVSTNLVFPCSLSYIIEDLFSKKDETIPAI